MENRNAEMNQHGDEENDSDENENDFTVYGKKFKTLIKEKLADTFHLSRMPWLS